MAVERNRFSLSVVVFMIFLVLKLSGVGMVATWSWWWVVSPLWIYGGLWILLLVLMFILMYIF